MVFKGKNKINTLNAGTSLAVLNIAIIHIVSFINYEKLNIQGSDVLFAVSNLTRLCNRLERIKNKIDFEIALNYTSFLFMRLSD